MKTLKQYSEIILMAITKFREKLARINLVIQTIQKDC